MKLLLDTCVLYPTVMREMLLGVAVAGAFEPFWSAEIEGEWAHTAEKHEQGARAFAEGEIALLNARWPNARVRYGEGLKAGSDTHLRAHDTCAYLGRRPRLENTNC